MVRRGWTAILATAALAALLTAADQGQPPADSKGRPAPAVLDDAGKPTATPAAGQDMSKEPRKPLSLETLKSPGGSILILYEELKDTLRLLPKAVVLTPEKYQELLDQLEQLRRQLKPDRPLVPSACKLSGRVDGDVARLRAQFEFKTERPRTSVVLGCRRGWALSAALGDGQLPVFQPLGDEGYVVFVSQPGTYQVTLELALPLATRGTDRVFDLDLPRCPITLLEQLDLPGAAAEVRVGGRVVRAKANGSPPVARVENVALGPVDRFEAVWRGPAAAPQKVSTILTARGRLVARVEEGLVRMEADLTLQVLSGATAQWRIQVPPALSLEKWQVLPGLGTIPPEKATAQDERVERIILPTESDPTLTILLKEPSAEPLRVVLHALQPRRGATVPVGPFAVFDVRPQHGTIEVRGGTGLRFRPVLRGEVVQREVTEEMRAQGTMAAFTYWDLPPARGPAFVPASLALELDPLKGAVEVRATHTLSMLPSSDGAAGSTWRIKTQLELTPVRTSVDRLEIELPAGYQFEDQAGVSPSDVVENPVEVKDGPGTRRTMIVKLAQRQLKPWTPEFSGLDSVAAGKQEEAFELPRLTQAYGGPRSEPLLVLDRGGRVQVALPAGLELAPRALPAEAALPRGTEPVAWPTERMPTRVELAWQARRAETPARITAEVVVAGRRVRVRERFQFTRPPRQLRVRVPAGIAGPVRLADGTELRPEGGAPPEAGGWTAELGPLREDAVTLTYTLLLPEPEAGTREPAETLVVPLLQPEGGGETRVLVWTEADVRPSLAEGAWEELPLEIGSDPDRLPDLVLRSTAEERLGLRLRRLPAAPHLAATVERVLVRVTVTDTGGQLYRVRYLLSKLHARHLDVELPVPLGRLGFGARLDGKEVRRGLVDEAGREVEVGRTVRLEVEPELYRKPVVLELTYPLSGGRSEGSTGWQSQLRPPVLHGASLLGRVRWSVELAPGWLAVYAGGASTEHRWGLLGWLPAPRPAASSEDLEDWFTGSTSSGPAEEGEPSLVCWQSAPAPLRVLHVPQQAWLLACSLTFLAIGLGLSFLPLPRTLFWLVVALLGALAGAVSVLWPSTLPVIAYGCEPAALVLLLVVCVQWTLQQRYRRRLIFLPGFTRMKAGSSLIQPAGPAREPSTVDQAPPRRGSSFAAEQGS